MLQQSLIGKTIGGRYQIEALLGQGGMSAVFKAADPNLRRTVAVKLIHPHLSADPNFVNRFKEEAAAVASLRHPNIVQVHDFAADGDTYYMVMEYLVGETLQARLKRMNAAGRQMHLAEAVSICGQIAAAAGYAHDHEMVHRDIKPANIMLDLHGQAILMDFGIVKIVGGDTHTSTGATVGTAMYMSPEQIRSERVDERSDIYSLGVTLYEMISGKPPYQADSAVTLMMMVLNDPLPDLREARPEMPEALRGVVLKAMAKEREERFQSMAEMAAALQQALAAAPEPPPEPVEAALLPDPSRTPVIAFEEPLAASKPWGEPAEPEPLRKEKPAAAPQVPAALPPEQAAPAAQPPAEKVKPAHRKNPFQWLLLAGGGLVLLALLALAILFFGSKKPPEISLASISRASMQVNAQTAPQTVKLGTWNIDSNVTDLVFSPDGSLLATANAREWARFTDYRYYASLWQVEPAGLKQYLLGHSDWVYQVDFSPDGSLLASGANDAVLRLWQMPQAALLREVQTESGGITSLAFAPNNQVLAVGTWYGVVGLWQVSSSNQLWSMQMGEAGIFDVMFSPDGNLLAAASEDGTIAIWKVSDGNLLYTLTGHTAAVHRLAFSPDGSLLASASEDETLRIWQVADGAPLNTLTEHAGPVKDVAFSPDGSLLASGSADHSLILWQPADGKLLRTLPGEDEIYCLAFAPDGTYLVSGEGNGAIEFWGISEALTGDSE